MACNSLNPICDVATAIGSLGSTVTSSVFNSVASAFGNTADSAINWLWQQLSTSTSISLGGANLNSTWASSCPSRSLSVSGCSSSK